MTDPLRGLTLYGTPGWGSSLVEVQLVFYGLDYRFENAGHLFEDRAAREALARINPVAQLPTLLLGDGTVMTESAAITLWLAEETGRDDLVPAPGDADRARFLRWLMFFNGSIYPTYTYGDVPSRFVPDPGAREGYGEAVTAHRKRLWAILGAEAGAPWFLGERFSALDVYVAGAIRWRPPGREWFSGAVPNLVAIARACHALPDLAETWRRNRAEA